ncbi:MAG TPA: hydrogenase expression/formation protein HypE [Gammaproteobacteria bacterium]|nr:hydrogenase expression/formation protein HypE [Gammaproteobacteria bacterium]
MQQTRISLAHGNGGRLMRELIEELFARHLANPELNLQADAAPLPLGGGELLFTTDGFIVQPLEFPGGDIGSLAIHGTCNDLAVAGAKPEYLALNVFLEEGMAIEQLERLMGSLARTARECEVSVVAGDTKVLPHGEGSGLYLATTGIGIRLPGPPLGMNRIRPGDHLVVSGPVGDHGTAVMLAREQFGLRGDLRSDAASVLPLTRAALAFEGLRFMRDPTRGGLATVCHEIGRETGLDIRLQETRIPVRDPVNAVCEILGYDPLFLACEGRVVAVVAPEQSETLLRRWRSLPQGEEAAIIGEMVTGKGRLLLQTKLGGERLLDELEEDPLPRIC